MVGLTLLLALSSGCGSSATPAPAKGGAGTSDTVVADASLQVDANGATDAADAPVDTATDSLQQSDNKDDTLDISIDVEAQPDGVSVDQDSPVAKDAESDTDSGALADGIDAGPSGDADAGADAAPECVSDKDCPAVLGNASDPCKAAACAAGTCAWQQVGAGASCDTDGLPCTAETCDAQGTCQFQGLGSGWCGIVVAGKPTCAAALANNPSNACEICDPNSTTTEWTPLADGTSCGPVQKGCIAQVCQSQACVSVPDAGLCDGATDCKAVTCTATFGCATQSLPASATCTGADGFACTIEHCDGKGSCQASGVPNDGLCDDGVACTGDSCDPAKGCVHTGKDSACDDGNTCTADSCAPTGCGHGVITGPCDDGSACTSGETCDGSVCKGGAEALWKSAITTKDVSFTHLEKRTGGVVALGNVTDGFVVAAVSDQGKVQWESVVLKKWWTPAGVVPLASGDILVVGMGAVEATGQNGALVIRFDAGGSQVSETELPKAVIGAVQSATVGDGDTWVVVHNLPQNESKFEPTFITQYDSKLKMKWQEELYGSTSSLGVRPSSKGGYFVFGSTLPTWDWNWAVPTVIRIDATGSTLWQRTYGGANDHGRLMSIVELADGGAIGVGQIEMITGNEAPYAVRLDVAGNAMWSRNLGGKLKAGIKLLMGSASAGADGVWAVEKADWYDPSPTTLVRLDGSGNAIQEITLEDQVGALLGVPGEPFSTMAVNTLPSSPTVTLPAGMHRFAGEVAVSCGLAGPCFGGVASLCDDGQVCTADTCDGIKGCSHKPLGDGSACEDGAACTAPGTCAAGACVAGPSTMISADIVGFLAESAVRLQGGEVVVCGAVGAQTPDVWAAKVGIDGKLAWKVKVDIGGQGNCVVAHEWGGDIVLQGNSYDLATSKDAMFAVILDPSGKQTSKAIYPASKGSIMAVAGRVLGRSESRMVGYRSESSATVIPADLSNQFPIDLPGATPQAAVDVGSGRNGNIVYAIADYLNGQVSKIKIESVDLPSSLYWSVLLPGKASISSSYVYGRPSLAVQPWGEVLVAYVATAEDANGPYTLRIAHISEDGQLLKVSDTGLDVGAYSSFDIAILDKGSFWLAGSRNYAQIGEYCWLARFSSADKLQWEITEKNACDVGSKLLAHPIGAMWMRTTQVPTGGPVTSIRTVTPWGTQSCADAGTCFTKSLADCNDGKPCTADQCDANTGSCTYTPIVGCGP